jgi:hypothetical protein
MFGEFSLLGFTFDLIWAWIALLIWIALAFWPARVAARKGHSFILYFLLSLVFFPLALVLAYVVSNRYAVQPPQQAPPAQSTEE